MAGLAVFVIGALAFCAWLLRLGRWLVRYPHSRWRWVWRVLGVPLALLGLYGVVGLAWMEWRNRRAGLGVGTLIAVALGSVKGIVQARHRSP
jgi:hypothetical protein